MPRYESGERSSRRHLSSVFVARREHRSYVVHGTNNVLLEDNVAFDSHGHCYITEDGSEEGNSFVNNLSVFNKHRFGVIGQSDDFRDRQQTSSFWIRNMKNNFIGNTVAGELAFRSLAGVSRSSRILVTAMY